MEAVNLTGQHAGCLHDYTLQHSDMIVLSHADALFINGAGMEPFLPVITGAYPALPVVDGTEGLFLPHSEGEQKEIMTEYCRRYSTDIVVCYCHYCLEGLKCGGKLGIHLAELLFG